MTRKIVVTGAGGLVGREFTHQLKAHNDLVGLTHRELDITNPELTNELIAHEPDLIINCAVCGVDSSEANPSLAQSVNVTGVANLARTAALINAELVHFSTNYVFDGKPADDLAFTIRDRPRPANVYGETKLAGERAAVSLCAKTFIIRTSWVFGNDRKNFLSAARSALEEERAIRAVSDVWASTTYVKDLVKRVVEIISRQKYATYHVVNAEICSYYEFALEMSRQLRFSDSKARALIIPAKASEVFSSARPLYSPMRCLVSEELGLAPMRSWRAAVAEFANESSWD